MYMTKQAIMLKEHDPNVQTYVFYIDMRAAGKNYEEFVRRAQDEYGTIYIRGRVGKIYPMGKKMIVRGEDSLIGRPVEVAADMVVLATGVTGKAGAQDLFQKLNISYDNYDFINEAHPKLRPVETNTDGIYLAGMVQGPKDIPDTVAQASAAAVKVCGLFGKESLTTDPQTSTVNQSLCVGCLLCKEVCPYNAIETEVTRDKRTVAKVNESVCKGCGVCVAACRGKAISLRGYSDEQLLAEVAALRW
jgi:heterodisulfide reductase subunit A